MSLQLPLPVGFFQADRSTREGQSDDLRATSFELARRFWYSMRRCWWAALWHLEVDGVEHVPTRGPVLLCANHVSHLDAPVLLQALGVDFRAVAKKEVFYVPFFSSVLRFAGFIEVDRADRVQATRAIARAVDALKGGACFLIFPEGTRSRTGALGPFKKGGFVVGMDAGSRIVPVALQGTGELMPRGGFRIRPGTVRVRVLDPVSAESYSYGDRDALIAAVRGRIAAALAG